MPSFNAHYLFAKTNIDTLKEIFSDVKINEEAVYYGTQGPDLMFFGRLMPVVMPGRSLQDIGDKLHAACPTTMVAVIRKFFKKFPEDDIAKSFLLGYLCHYTLDRNCHPFVYAKEQMIWEQHQNYDRLWIHNVIEHNMDSYIIRKLLNTDDAGILKSYKVLSTDKEVIAACGRALAYLVPRVTDETITEKEGELSCKDSRTIMFLLGDKTGLKRNTVGKLGDAIVKKKIGPMFTCFFVPRQPMTDYNYFSDDHEPWLNPHDPDAKPRTESFYELFEYACTDLKEILTKLKASMDDSNYDMESITGNLSFDKGSAVPYSDNLAIKD